MALIQMATIISYGSEIDVVKIGRIAGQYAKPRTANLETRDNITLPSYRGDSINDIKYNLNARTPNPERLLRAYHKSVATLNLIKPVIKNEFQNLKYFWDSHIFDNAKIYNRFEKTINNINKSLKFLNTIGTTMNLFEQERFNEFYASHECLLLDYESAFTNKNVKNQYYNSSGHMLWLGDRTRNINSAHVEYLSGHENPICIKSGPSLDIAELKIIIAKLNPFNEVGKIILICRFGIKSIGVPTVCTPDDKPLLTLNILLGLMVLRTKSFSVPIPILLPTDIKEGILETYISVTIPVVDEFGIS